MDACKLPEMAGRTAGGMFEYVVTFHGDRFEREVWPAIEHAFTDLRLESLEAVVAVAMSASPGEPDDPLPSFIRDLRAWLPRCHSQGRHRGVDPFCQAPGPDCRQRSAEGDPMCAMKDCYRRLTTVVLRLCRPPVKAGALLARARLDADALCQSLVWAVANEDEAGVLLGSVLHEFPAELNRTSLSVYLTHYATQRQVVHAAGAAARWRSVLADDLDLAADRLDALGRFWEVAAQEGVGLALCYAEP